MDKLQNKIKTVKTNQTNLNKITNIADDGVLNLSVQGSIN